MLLNCGNTLYAVLMRRAFTWSGVSAGFCSSSNAAGPTDNRCGHAGTTQDEVFVRRVIGIAASLVSALRSSIPRIRVRQLTCFDRTDAVAGRHKIGFDNVVYQRRALRAVSGDDIVGAFPVQESQWLLKLHTYGLLNNSFQPVSEIRVLRTYWRQRAEHVHGAATSIQRMQEALTLMNVQLANVISDISGLTGQAIVRAIVAGDGDTQQLAALSHPRIQASQEEIAKSLEGNWRPELLFVLQQEVDRYLPKTNRGVRPTIAKATC